MADWKADAGLVSVEITNAAKVVAGLKVAPRLMTAQQRRSAERTARGVGGWVAAAASSGSAQQARMASGIQSAATSSAAVLTLQNTLSAPGAMGAFLGARQYLQFPPPVAPGWVIGGPGGPLVINPTYRAHEAEIGAFWLDGQVDAATRDLPRA